MLVAPPGSAPRVRATAKPHPHPQVGWGSTRLPRGRLYRRTTHASAPGLCRIRANFSSALTIGRASSERERPQPPAIGGDVDAGDSALHDLETDQRNRAPPRRRHQDAWPAVDDRKAPEPRKAAAARQHPPSHRVGPERNPLALRPNIHAELDLRIEHGYEPLEVAGA